MAVNKVQLLGNVDVTQIGAFRIDTSSAQGRCNSCEKWRSGREVGKIRQKRYVSDAADEKQYFDERYCNLGEKHCELASNLCMMQDRNPKMKLKEALSAYDR